MRFFKVTGRFGLFYVVSICILSTSFPTPVLAQNHTEDTLQKFVNVALLNNPRLKAAEKAYHSAQKGIPFAHALPDPTLVAHMRNVGIQEISIGSEPMSGTGVMLQQNYPNPAKLKLKEQLAYQQSLRLAEELNLKKRELQKQVKTLYLEQIYYRQAIAVDKEIQKILKSIKKTLLVYYEVGKTPQKDVWRIQREHSRLNQSQKEWSRLLMVSSHSFRKLLGWPKPEILAPISLQKQFPKTSFRTPKNWSWEQHPAWKIQHQKMVMAELEHKLAEAYLRPDYMIAGGVTQRATLEPIWEIKGGMSLPIYAKQKQFPKIASAQLKKEQEQALLELETQKLQQQWETAQGEQRNDKEQLQIMTKQLIPETRLHIDASLAAYLTQPREFESIMQSLADLLNYQQKANQYRLRILTAQNQLEYLSGKPLL